ncbi:MAG: hypothetical protein LC802_04450 [Acidobacteria bacterium]|nr:hypothetical protein [Acidobacteriota bacterium]
MSRAVIAAALVLSSCLAFSHTTVAQGGSPNLQHTKNTPDLGLRGELKVDPSTLGMSIQIPLGGYPGRAGTGKSLGLYYNSKVWRIEFDDYVNGNMSNCSNPEEVEVGIECYTTTRALYAEKSVAGWTFGGAFPTIEYGDERYDSDGRACCNGDPNLGKYIPRMTVRFPDGSTHELRRGDAPLTGADPLTGTYHSVDSSRMKFLGTSPGAGTLYLPDGSRYEFANWAATRYVDRNGNVLTAQMDTLGRQVFAPTFHNSFAHTETRSIPGVGGSLMSYTFDLRELGSVGVLEPDMLTGGVPALRRIGDSDKFGNNVYAASLFTSVSGNRLINPSIFNPVVLHRIVLPDGSAYTFTYNEYGEIARVVYPMGGSERYRYAFVQPLAVMDAPYSQANRGVLEKRVSATGSAADEVKWLYGSSGTTVTTFAPDSGTPEGGTRTVRLLHTGYSFGSVVFGLDDPRAGMAYDERVYAPQSRGGAMLRRTLTEWGVSGPEPGGHTSAKRNPKVLKTVEVLLDTGAGNPLARTTTYQYGQASQPLNVTAVNDHEYVAIPRATAEGGPLGDIPSGVALRSTETAYKDDPAYHARNLVALPRSTTVRAGGPENSPVPGVVVGRAEIYYDEEVYFGTDMSLLHCGATQGREASTPPTRGNVTTSSRWLDTLGAVDNSSAYLDTHTRYDQCGSTRQTWDAGVRGTISARVSEVEYSASNQFAYPTRTISTAPDTDGVKGSSVPFEMSSAYDFETGLILSVTDVNNQTTIQYSYSDAETGVVDPLGRLRRVSHPDGGSTRYDFGDTPGKRYVRSRTALDATRSTDSYQYFDGLGRPSRAYSYDGSAPVRTWIATKMQYDDEARQVKVSNPHFRNDLADFDLNSASNTIPVTTSTSDPLGRVTSVLSPDGAMVASEYKGVEVTVTDPAGKQRRSVSDSLGRVVKVIEAPGVAHYGFETVYAYDVLGNLLQVTQGKTGQAQQTRTFVYDSLSRLSSAINPESGTLSYEYDAYSNLKKKVDARQVQTEYVYDSLNRIVRRSYSLATGASAPPSYVAAPAADYYYDGTGVPAGVAAPTFSNGRLTAVKSAVSQTIYTEFDAVGRVRKHRQVSEPGTTAEQAYLMEYGYNLAGALTSQKFPSGRVVPVSYDNAGRISRIGDANSKVYADTFKYAAHGAVEEARLGNGLWEQTQYNQRLQPEWMKLGTAGGTSDRWQLVYGYGPTAENNGNVRQQTITVPAVGGINGFNAVQSYTYDPLNRIETARETKDTASGAESWKQRFAYDHFGNRRIDGNPADPSASQTTPALIGPNPTISPATNRISSSGYGYDSAGNLTSTPSGDTFLSYDYDAENKQVAFRRGQTVEAEYTYDGDGRRVRKVVGAGASAVTTVFVYDAAGRLVAEYSNGAQTSAGGTNYLTQDHLGSTRVVTRQDKSVQSRHDFLPHREHFRVSQCEQ